jgi:hypothetical protein
MFICPFKSHAKCVKHLVEMFLTPYESIHIKAFDMSFQIVPCAKHFGTHSMFKISNV